MCHRISQYRQKFCDLLESAVHIISEMTSKLRSPRGRGYRAKEFGEQNGSLISAETVAGMATGAAVQAATQAAMEIGTVLVKRGLKTVRCGPVLRSFASVESFSGAGAVRGSGARDLGRCREDAERPS